MSGFALKNLKLLKMDMEDKGWQIDSFVFRYKSQEYIVLVKLYSKEEKKPNYALLKLEFLRRGNINDNLEVPANSVSLMTDAQTLRKYFQIDYSENLGIYFNSLLNTLVLSFLKKFQIIRPGMKKMHWLFH